MTHVKRLRALGRCSLAAATILALAAVALPAPAGAASGDLFNNTNVYGVLNRPTRPTTFTLTAPAQITELVTYHWNNGHGARPGTIGLRAASGHVYGPYRAHGTSGQNNAPNVNWIATPLRKVVINGTYACVSTSRATWSQNIGSGGKGYCRVWVQPATLI